MKSSADAVFALVLGAIAAFNPCGFDMLFVGVNAAMQGTILPYLPPVTSPLGVVLEVLGGITLVTGELQGPANRVAGAAARSGDSD